jgi:hypothetical protein
MESLTNDMSPDAWKERRQKASRQGAPDDGLDGARAREKTARRRAQANDLNNSNAAISGPDSFQGHLSFPSTTMCNHDTAHVSLTDHFTMPERRSTGSLTVNSCN